MQFVVLAEIVLVHINAELVDGLHHSVGSRLELRVEIKLLLSLHHLLYRHENAVALLVGILQLIGVEAVAVGTIGSVKVGIRLVERLYLRLQLSRCWLFGCKTCSELVARE